MKNSTLKKVIIFTVVLIASILMASKSFALTKQTEKVLGTEQYSGITWTKLEGDTRSVNVGKETKYNPGLEMETGVIKYFTVVSGSNLVNVQKVKTNVTEYLLIKGLKAGTAKINVYYCPAGTVNEYNGIHKYSLKTLTVTVTGTSNNTAKVNTNVNKNINANINANINTNTNKTNTVGKTNTNKTVDNTEYTITYMVDGKAYKTQKYKLGTTVTLASAPEKEGYQFVEWNTNSDGTGNSRAAGYKLSVNYTKNITYYAIFKSKIDKVKTSKIIDLDKEVAVIKDTPIYSESGELIANVATGEKIKILGEVADNYYRIKWTKNNVYVTVNSKYITVENNIGTTKSIGVNIREKSNKESKCFGDIVVGKVNINDKENSYYKVDFEIEGFIKKDAIDLTSKENNDTKTNIVIPNNLLNSILSILNSVVSTSKEVKEIVNENAIKSNTETIVDSAKTIISEESTDTQKTEAIEKGITSTINIFSEITVSSLKLLNTYLANR